MFYFLIGDLGEWGLNLIDKGSGMNENAVLNGFRLTIHKGMYIAMCSAFGVRRSSRCSMYEPYMRVLSLFLYTPSAFGAVYGVEGNRSLNRRDEFI